MEHNRDLSLVIGINIFRSETARHLEVNLNRTALPAAAEAPVKGTVTKIFVGPAAGVEAGETLMTIDVTGASGTEAGENGATGAAVDGTATDGTMEGGK